MSGKGSGRRPQFVDEAQAADNWNRIFGRRPSDGRDVEGEAQAREQETGDASGSP